MFPLSSRQKNLRILFRCLPRSFPPFPSARCPWMHVSSLLLTPQKNSPPIPPPGLQEAGGACFRTTCGHFYCESCAFQHFGQSQACAVCGTALQEADISELNLGLASSDFGKIVFQVCCCCCCCRC